MAPGTPGYSSVSGQGLPSIPMRHHPIPPVSEPLQYRAIGVVRGVYVPEDPEQLTRGVIRTADGAELEAVVLGRVLTLLRRHINLEQPHLWVVYPRSRDEERLHLQMMGIWEPSTLAIPADVDAATMGSEGPAQASAADASVELPPSAEQPAASEHSADADVLPEGDDYFSVRGELIYTRPETGDLVIKVRQLPRADGSRPTPFKLQLKGVIPLEHLRHFLSLDLRRQGQLLQLEHYEVIGPLAQRGNRGGKGGRNRPGRSSGADRPARRSGADRPGGDRPGADRSGGDRSGGSRPPASPRTAVTRPLR